jgi:hypothetical protein
MSVALGLPAEKVEQDPKLSLEVADMEDLDLSTTPANDLVANGLAGLLMALNLCPEAAASAKRTKQIHKKGEVAVEGADLRLKWNVDYKAGNVLNLRVVTLKPDGKDAAQGGAGAGAGAVSEGETAAPAPVAGRKRARKEPVKPEELDVRGHLQVAHEACVAQGKAAEAESLAALIASLA